MHLGGLGIVARNSKKNFKYILINNGSHESVGGQPTIAFDLNLKHIFQGLGFKEIFEVSTEDEINKIFKEFIETTKSILIVNVKLGSRKNLGRPTNSPKKNKSDFMNFIKDSKFL